MFERYTEKARRVIFFARYEASNHGSSSIDTEHLLLGVMREGQALIRQFLPVSVTLSSVREDVEKVITRGKRIPTSVEIPLSGKAKEALVLASEEAERLNREHIDLEQILVGILMVEGSLASRILTERGVELEILRKQLATTRPAVTRTVTIMKRSLSDPVDGIHRFLNTVKSNDAAELGRLFATNAQVIDSKGRRWKGREEIEKEAGKIFFSYSKKDVTFHVESVDAGPGNTFAVSVLWKGVIQRGREHQVDSSDDGCRGRRERLGCALRSGDSGGDFVEIQLFAPAKLFLWWRTNAKGLGRRGDGATVKEEHHREEKDQRGCQQGENSKIERALRARAQRGG